MALEGVAVAAATNVATDLMKTLITTATSAARCQQECNELRKSLETIQPGVQAIEIQLSELGGGDGDLKLVEDWLEELKRELHVASIHVHKCNTGSWLARYLSVWTNHKLAKRITVQNEKITRLAAQRVIIHLLLTDRVSRIRHNNHNNHNSHNNYNNHNNYKNSVHHGYGSPGGGQPSTSQHHGPWHRTPGH